MAKIGENIKRVRAKQGITQDDLARKILAVVLLATTPLSPVPPTSKNVLKLSPPFKGVYLGTWNQDGVGRKLFENMVGRMAPLFGGGFDTDCKDGGTEGTMPKIDIACREARFNNGYLSTYGIETYVRGEDAEIISPIPQGKITPQDIIDGKVDAELQEIAKAIADSGKPILWLYHEEPYLQFGGYGEDGTFPLPLCDRTPGCSLTEMFGDKSKKDGPERYIALARHIHNIVEGEIKRLGRESPIVWVMGALSTGELNYSGFYTEYYPGNNYVDWHAFNWYPMEKEGAKITQYESISQSPGWKEALVLDPGKPILIREFGVSSLQGDRSAWFQAFFNDVRANPAMKNLAGFIYWQEDIRYQQGEPIRTRIPLTVTEENVWKQEVKEYPDYWNSTLRFAE